MMSTPDEVVQGLMYLYRLFNSHHKLYLIDTRYVLNEPYKFPNGSYINWHFNPTINSTVNQGPRLGAKEPIRTTFMAKRSFDHDWYSEYHTFAVEWRPGDNKHLFNKVRLKIVIL